MADHLELVQPVADAPYPTGAHFDRDPRNDDHPLTLALAGRAVSGAQTGPWARQAPIWDQGADSRCVAEAIAGLVVTEPWVHGMSLSQLALAMSPSAQDGRQWVYRVAQTEDGITVPHEGTTSTAGFKAARTADLQPERETTQPGHVGQWGYAWAADLSEVIAYLSTVGPMVLATLWHAGMWEPDQSGFIHATGGPEAGHAVLLDWYDSANRRFRITNSWGDAWGPLGGRAYISEDDLDFLLGNGGQISGWYRR